MRIAHEVGNTSRFCWSFFCGLGRQIVPPTIPATPTPPPPPSHTLYVSGWRRGLQWMARLWELTLLSPTNLLSSEIVCNLLTACIDTHTQTPHSAGAPHSWLWKRMTDDHRKWACSASKTMKVSPRCLKRKDFKKWGKYIIITKAFCQLTSVPCVRCGQVICKNGLHGFEKVALHCL